MKLLTKEIRKKLPAFNKTENSAYGEIEVLAKFFNPAGNGTWYAWEGEAQIDENGQEIDFLFFGLADLGFGYPELGYFSLKELESIRLPFGLRIERDLHWSGTAKDVLLNSGLENLVSANQARIDELREQPTQ